MPKKTINENLKIENTDEHWAYKIADKLIKNNPKKKKFICAAGISPSGKIHIGNFRDIITSDLVCRALRDKGFKAELIFSWDDYDRFRKVPAGIPESFSKYIGMPLSEIPDPNNCHKSYAQHFEKEFEEIVAELGLSPRFIYQSQEYSKNRYFNGIKTALQKRQEIAKILAQFKTQGMTDAEAGEYYPLQIYCSKCKKDFTKIIDYDNDNKITYECKCGHKEIVDISKKNIGKLAWKIDWAMRWSEEDVAFEPGGEDHATPGGSYDVSSRIAKEIFKINPPEFQGYGFVGIEGITKMSGSSGTGITPKDLLKIYEPELLRWIFTRANPKKEITLFFDTEIIRQYDEFDKEVEEFYKNDERKKEIILSSINSNKFPEKIRTPFRQVASFGQIAQGNFEELKNFFERIGQDYDEQALKIRLEKSQNWIENFAPELKIKLRNLPNKEYFKKLNEKEKKEIVKLKENLNSNWDLEKLTALVYEIPKETNINDEEKKKRQRNFFKNVYQLLIDNDTGPRLPAFLLAVGKEKIKAILQFN
ncbi:MAG: lysine--tRNA ligase [Nanoarchaeota archaeon]